MGIPVQLPRSVNGEDLLKIIEEVARSLDNVYAVYRFPRHEYGLISGSVHHGEFDVGETIVVRLKEKKIKRSMVGIILYPLAVLFGFVGPEVREIELLPVDPNQNYSQVQFQLLIRKPLDVWETISKTKESWFEDFIGFVEKLFERIAR